MNYTLDNLDDAFFASMERIRKDGLINMFDRKGVAFYLSANGDVDAAFFVQENRHAYGEILDKFGEWLSTRWKASRGT